MAARIGAILWWLAAICGMLLLFAPATARTTWRRHDSAGGEMFVEGVGWQGVAALLAVMAIVFLALAFRFRSMRPAAVAGTTLAAVVFAATAIGLYRDWAELTQGIANGTFGAGWEITPAPAMPIFAAIAVAGALFAGALGLSMLMSLANLDKIEISASPSA